MSTENNCCPKVETCINPIIEAFKNWSNLQTFEEGLDAGLVLTHSGNICCPDCISPTGYYFLGGIIPFTALLTATGGTYPCCINHSLNATNNGLFIGAVGANTICCNTDFFESISLLSTLGIDTGNIIESSSFNNNSGLNIFLNYADLEAIDTAIVLQFLNAIIENGLVIKCTKCEIFIGSVEAFGTYNN